MNAKQLNNWSLRLKSLCLLGLLTSCTSSVPADPTASNSPMASPTTTTTVTPAEPPAKVTEIFKQPVSVRPLQAKQDVPAAEGMSLQIGETIRTKGEAMAQITLKNGLGFRIGRDSVLTIQPDNRLNLTAGDMITWVEPGQKVPAEIVTPTAIAGIRGTTVFVKIPQNPNEETTFFSWEGTVAVRLIGQTEELVLQTGEEIKIRPGERDLAKLRQRVRRLNEQEYKERRQNSLLFRQFKRPLPTLRLIESGILNRAKGNPQSLIQKQSQLAKPDKVKQLNSSIVKQQVENRQELIQQRQERQRKQLDRRLEKRKSDR